MLYHIKLLTKRLPLASSGLILGIIALANLLNQLQSRLGYPVLGIAICLLVWFLLHLASNYKQVRNELSQTIPLSSFGTLSMSILLLSGQDVMPLLFRQMLWWLGLALHLAIILIFSKKISQKWDFNLVYPSWFIVYVGIAAASITAPAVSFIAVGRIAFIFALISYLILLPVLLYRIFRFGKIAEPLRANIAILAAPSSLLLLACLALQLSTNWVICLLTLSQTLYLITFFLLRPLKRSRFTPTWSALTFPSVSTALALKLSLHKLGITSLVIHGLLYVEITLAILIICYITIKISQNILTSQ